MNHAVFKYLGASVLVCTSVRFSTFRLMEMVTTLELQETYDAGLSGRKEGIRGQKCFFLIRLENCNHCTFSEETRAGVNSLFNCEDCIKKTLDKSGFNVTVKCLDKSRYRLLSKKSSIRHGNEGTDNKNEEKRKTYSEKIKIYEAWIIDQISSGNHKIIDDAQNGSLFSQKIKTAFLDAAFINLEERNIIKRDIVTGNYYLVYKNCKTEEKEIQWNYCVSYVLLDKSTTKNANEKFKTLEDALAFVKSHNLMNYYIQRRVVNNTASEGVL